MPDFHVAFRNLLHAVNLRHGTDGFTSPPKESLLRIFSPWKIRRLGPGLNPPTCVPKASTLNLDHRSRLFQGQYRSPSLNSKWGKKITFSPALDTVSKATLSIWQITNAKSVRPNARRHVDSSWNVMAHGDACGGGSEGKWNGWSVLFTLSRIMVYPALLPLMRTPLLQVVDWSDGSADLNGLVRFGERRNLVPARVPSHFKRSLHSWTSGRTEPRSYLTAESAGADMA